jgi:uncharacterized cupredoxin-like copper-binding protein
MRLPLPKRALAGLGAVVAAVGGLGVVAASGGSADDGDASVLGPGRDSVVLGIEHSRFGDDRIVVRRGTTLTFVVDNGDPIGHELIVGPPEVHARHELGTEAAHPPVPGEVTAPALASVETTYTFDEVGSVTFACHLPGHVAYGMVGEVLVVDDDH